MKYKIFPLGDNALTIEFGNEISAELNNRVLNLARFFDRKPFIGLIEIVPAYASLTVFYDISRVRKNFPNSLTAFEAVKNLTEIALRNANDIAEAECRLMEIPICFDAKYALDLESVASLNNLTQQEVIEIFLSKTYRVYMLGFLPGFSYMGEVAKEIAAPRRENPRLIVPKGSVGIAGQQTGIYSLESPGGWQIIGRTNIEMFTPNEEIPTYLQAGDFVKFYPANFNSP
jgi:inhibitor of KinA